MPGGEYEADEARAATLDFLMAGDVASRPQAAVRFALMHPGVSMVLVGLSSLAQLEEAAACSGSAPPARCGDGASACAMGNGLWEGVESVSHPLLSL